MAMIFEEICRHHVWADVTLLDVCARLDDDGLHLCEPGTYGSVRDTLVHIVANEETYLATVTGEEPERLLRQGVGFPGLEAPRERAERGGASAVLTGTLSGRRYAMSAAVPMIQAITHVTEHRAHVVSILTQHGVDMPVLDGWEYGKAAGLLTFA